MKTVAYLTLLLTALSATVRLTAQAPVERQPPNTPTSEQLRSEVQWLKLEKNVARGYHVEFRVDTINGIFRCRPEHVNNEALICKEYRPSPGVEDIIYPREKLYLERTEITEIRVGGRELSTLTGMGVGAAIVALGSIKSGGNPLGTLLMAGVGGVIGHFIPFRGHVIYSQQ